MDDKSAELIAAAIGDLRASVDAMVGAQQRTNELLAKLITEVSTQSSETRDYIMMFANN